MVTTRVAACLLLVVLAAACGDGSETVTPSPTTTPDRTVAVLEAEVERLEHELVRSNADQLDLREKVRQLYVDRASRNAPRRRTTAAAAGRAPAHGNWAALINQYPWPAGTAYRVMMCESGGNANAYNARSGATGLFQILHGPYDPAANVALAFQMWSKRGWQPWKACI